MNEVYNFLPSDKTILIGRMVDCRIRFDDSSMSRYQCTIFFDSIKGWMLVDGTTEKRSTNGTWLFVEEEYEIFEGMIFKAGKTLFEAHIL
jgi:pSer/pThr/pTyr-binding forkhead associated (FHA) protein